LRHHLILNIIISTIIFITAITAITITIIIIITIVVVVVIKIVLSSSSRLNLFALFECLSLLFFHILASALVVV
jgi:hypothetical protein